MVPHQTKLRHLFLRAGFGASPLDIQQLQSKSMAVAVDELFRASGHNRDLNYLKSPISNIKGKDLSKLKILFQILRSREQIKELNIAWLDKWFGYNAPAILNQNFDPLNFI